MRVHLYKKLLKKQHVYRNKKTISSDVIIPTNNLFIFRDLLNLTIECTRGQIKAFSCLFCTTSDLVILYH